jgi:hypothetical protein
MVTRFVQEHCGVMCDAAVLLFLLGRCEGEAEDSAY